MRHENGAEIGGQHVLDFAAEHAGVDEGRQNGLLGQLVHVGPLRDFWTHGHQDPALRGEDGPEHDALLWSELPRDGKGAGDVAAIAMVLGTHVEKGDVGRGEAAVVGSTRVAVVEDGGVGT